MHDYYELLKLPADFTKDELRTAYKEAMRRYHPDVAGDTPNALELSIAVNTAYETFSSPSKKFDYDRQYPQFKQRAASKRGWSSGSVGKTTNGDYIPHKSPPPTNFSQYRTAYESGHKPSAQRSSSFYSSYEGNRPGSQGQVASQPPPQPEAPKYSKKYNDTTVKTWDGAPPRQPAFIRPPGVGATQGYSPESYDHHWGKPRRAPIGFNAFGSLARKLNSPISHGNSLLYTSRNDPDLLAIKGCLLILLLLIGGFTSCVSHCG